MKKAQNGVLNIVCNSFAKTLTRIREWCKMKVDRGTVDYMAIISIKNTSTRVMRISNYVISFSENKKIPITNLKLQKILYYIQGYFFQKFGKAAFTEEIHNWQYGPVVPSVYYEYNSNGSLPLRSSNSIDTPLEEKEKKLINTIVEKCLSISTSKLVSMTHSETPWKKSEPGSVISKNSIKLFFDYNDPLEMKNDRTYNSIR